MATWKILKSDDFNGPQLGPYGIEMVFCDSFRWRSFNNRLYFGLIMETFQVIILQNCDKLTKCYEVIKHNHLLFPFLWLLVFLLHCLVQFQDTSTELFLQGSQRKSYLVETWQIFSVFGQILLNYLVDLGVIRGIPEIWGNFRRYSVELLNFWKFFKNDPSKRVLKVCQLVIALLRKPISHAHD